MRLHTVPGSLLLVFAVACADSTTHEATRPPVTGVAKVWGSDPASCVLGASGPGVLEVATYTVSGSSAESQLAALSGVWCVTGNLRIYDTRLTSLAGLHSLMAVGGTLSVGMYGLNKGNPLLSSLSGLENLRRAGTLELFKNTALADVSALSSLRSVGSIHLHSHPALTSLPFLHNFSELPGSLLLDALALPDLSSLASLTRLGGALRIQDAPGITAATGLEALHGVGGQLTFSRAGALTSLHGLENLESVGSLTLNVVPQLADISALSGLVSLQRGLHLIETGLSDLAALASMSAALPEYLTVLGNPLLANLEGLEGVSSVARGVLIEGNPALSTLSGLEGIGFVGEDLAVRDNPALTELEGLSQLSEVGGQLELRNNPALASLSGLRSLTHVGGDVTVSDNPSLSVCDVAALEQQTGLDCSACTGNGPLCE